MRLSERRVHCGLGVLAGYDQRVLLGGAVDHFVAGFQGHPRPGLWRAGLASLGDPNTLEDDEDASGVRFDGVFRLLLLGHGPTVKFRRDTASTLLRDFRSHLADNAQGLAHTNDHAAGAFPSMTLFLAAIVVFAVGLLGTLFLLFRDAHRGTKGLKRFLLSNWK